MMMWLVEIYSYTSFSEKVKGNFNRVFPALRYVIEGHHPFDTRLNDFKGASVARR